jgi:hypothetical protein
MSAMQTDPIAADTNYIMTCRGKRIVVTGPFASEADAIAFGQRWQEENDGNPCWQQLSGNGADPVVVSMQAAPTAGVA